MREPGVGSIVIDPDEVVWRRGEWLWLDDRGNALKWEQLLERAGRLDVFVWRGAEVWE